MRIFHIAAVADWNAPAAAKHYRISTRGRSLDEVGYIHAARREQVAGVFREFYAGHRGPWVLLAIETDKLTSPWREDRVGEQTFPHIHGPLNRDAVVDVQALNARGGTVSLLQLFLREMLKRMAAAMGVMLLAVVGVFVGRATGYDWGPFLGGLAGIGLGALAWWLLSRRIARRAGSVPPH